VFTIPRLPGRVRKAGAASGPMRSSLAILALLVAVAMLPESTAAANRLRPPVVLGANTTGITEGTGQALDRFAAEAGRMPRIAMYYRDWNEEYLHALISPPFLKPILARRAVPMITWLPRLGSADPIHQPAYAPAAIAAGAHDSFIRRAAREAAAYDRAFFIRFAHEMNGPWSPWGAWVDGNRPSDYVAMWRHVVSIFRAEGAANVRWVWSPNVYNPGGTVLDAASAMSFQPFYPGDRWVDFVALDGYNWGALDGLEWRTFSSIFKSSYDALGGLTRRPTMIAETASTELGGDKAAWIREIPAALRSEMPKVRALIWFDRDKETDWTIDSSPAAAAAFRALARNPLLSGSARRLLGSAKPRRHPPHRKQGR
jgi:Glycosyl hydrolase family 26